MIIYIWMCPIDHMKYTRKLSSNTPRIPQDYPNVVLKPTCFLQPSQKSQTKTPSCIASAGSALLSPLRSVFWGVHQVTSRIGFKTKVAFL